MSKNIAESIKRIHGEDFYHRIGAIGGKAKVDSKGFGYDRRCSCELIEYPHLTQNCAGKKGGMKSKRLKKGNR